MWTVAGVLIGVMVLASSVTVRSGPPLHLVGAAVGILTATWLVLMAADGQSAPVLWVLLGADLVVSAGVARGAVGGRRHAASDGTPVQHLSSIDRAEGVAVSDLSAEGIVRVHGEEWTAVAVDGPVRAGSRVQVVRTTGVHLEVRGEGPDPQAAGVPPLRLEDGPGDPARRSPSG